MDVHQILEQLIQERDRLEEAIISLERLLPARGSRHVRSASGKTQARQPGPPIKRKPKAKPGTESVS